MKRAVAFDVGTHTIGVAQSDVMKMLAQPIKTFRYQEAEWAVAFKAIFEQLELKSIDVYVVGYPKMMNNSLGESAKRSERFAQELADYIKLVWVGAEIEIILQDERLTTVQAEKILVSLDMSRKKRKAVIDTVAAVLILEDYLQSQKK
ncbi:putative pre-16S rRNA nuclease [Erysipelotrichaceae bacterium]|nr:putative pre-16S rRNA nuclease [Erysipelotrichaceae bacterium]